jgi:hypothetical protein
MLGRIATKGGIIEDNNGEVEIADLEDDNGEEGKIEGISATCIFTITRGPRKGQACGKKSTCGTSFCTTHRPAIEGKVSKSLKTTTVPLPIHTVLRHVVPIEPIIITTDKNGRMFWGNIVLVPVKNLKNTDMNVGFAAVGEINSEGNIFDSGFHDLTAASIEKCNEYNIPFIPPTQINEDTGEGENIDINIPIEPEVDEDDLSEEGEDD